MDLDDFIIRLFKAHLMIYPPNEPPERKQEEEKENNMLSYTWLCINGKPINHVINFDSIEGKHFLHKIKTFIVDYPQMQYVEERKENRAKLGEQVMNGYSNNGQGGLQNNA